MTRGRTFYILLAIAVFIVGSATYIFAEYKKTTTTTTTTTIERDVDELLTPVGGADKYLDVDIRTKRVYRSPQVVDGNVVVRNDYSAPLPGVFKIQLYHNDKFVKQLETKIDSIRPGYTTYSLDQFGIPEIRSSSTAQHGNWTIVVFEPEEGVGQSKEASFQILPVF